jgi:transposase
MADVDAGMLVKDVAIKFRVSKDWIYKLQRLRRETGSFGPRQQRTVQRGKLDDALPQLKQLAERHPDATLKELRDKLGLAVGVSTLWRALRKLKFTFKKKYFTPPSNGVPMYRFNAESGKLDNAGYLLNV